MLKPSIAEGTGVLGSGVEGLGSGTVGLGELEEGGFVIILWTFRASERGRVSCSAAGLVSAGSGWDRESAVPESGKSTCDEVQGSSRPSELV